MIQILAKRNGEFVGTGAVASDIHTLLLNHQFYIEKFPENERHNLFFTLSHFSVETSEMVIAPGAFCYQTALLFSVKESNPGSSALYAECLAAVLGCLKDSLIIVRQNRETCLLVHLKTPVRRIAAFKKDLWYRALCEKLQREVQNKRLMGTVDCGQFGHDVVVNLPGSIERADTDRVVELLQYSATTVDISTKSPAGKAKRRLSGRGLEAPRKIIAAEKEAVAEFMGKALEIYMHHSVSIREALEAYREWRWWREMGDSILNVYSFGRLVPKKYGRDRVTKGLRLTQGFRNYRLSKEVTEPP